MGRFHGFESYIAALPLHTERLHTCEKEGSVESTLRWGTGKIKNGFCHESYLMALLTHSSELSSRPPQTPPHLSTPADRARGPPLWDIPPGAHCQRLTGLQWVQSGTDRDGRGKDFGQLTPFQELPVPENSQPSGRHRHRGRSEAHSAGTAPACGDL